MEHPISRCAGQIAALFEKQGRGQESNNWKPICESQQPTAHEGIGGHEEFVSRLASSARNPVSSRSVLLLLGQPVQDKGVSFFEGKRVWVVGHSDPVGSAIVHRLWREPCEIVLTARSQLDLLRQADVEDWMRKQRPDVVFLTDHRDDTDDRRSRASNIQRILMINCNVVSTAHEIGVAALVNVSAAGLHAAGPDRGVALRRNEGLYSAARRIALRLTTAYSRQYGSRFVALLADNVYGPNDEIGSERSLTGPSVNSLVQKLAVAAFQEEQQVTLPYEGGITYALIHLDDLADAAVFLAEEYGGHDIVFHDAETTVSFRDLALLVAEIVGFRGDLLLNGPAIDQEVDLARAHFRRIDTLGWQPKVMLRHGIQDIHSKWLRHFRERVSAAH